ncbi:MAG: acetyl-CoA carboxylase biotin carboxyl carrier protein subunit, partial [Chloroflexi bacterium]|nr:acetyl-CoA carboxylase biotin carboxyl carrier protein subunit [Chloroflexota bacterium]
MQSVDGGQVYSLLLGDHSYEIFVDRTDTGYTVLVAGERHEVSVQDEYTSRLSHLGGQSRGPKGDAQIKAPMPGLVVAVRVAEGEKVKHGQGLLILEAMKMENELRAPWGGTVKSLRVSAGEKVEQGQLLVVLTPE